MTKILLADDSVTIQKVVELTFSDGESQVVAVSDGTAALEKAQMDRPDIILSDVIMPGMNGYELCQRIKSDPNLRSIPFLFLKGTFESFDEERARQCGSDGYIVKPFESQELIKKVSELLAASAVTEPLPAEPFAPPSPPSAREPVAAPPPPSAAAPTPAPAGLEPEAASSEAVPAGESVFDLSDELSAAEPEPDIFGEERPTEVEEEDLWSEVSLRDTSAPLLEDKVLEEESFWGTAEETGGGRPGEPAGEDLLEEVREPEIYGLVGDDEGPAAAGGAAETTEEGPAPVPLDETSFEMVAQEEFAPPSPAAAEPFPGEPPPQPAAEAAAPSADEPPPASSAATPVVTKDLERAVSAKLEEAIRAVLAPVIGEAARKIVEEVAWEVVPDLAEAMIKSEIENIRKSGSGE